MKYINNNMFNIYYTYSYIIFIHTYVCIYIRKCMHT